MALTQSEDDSAASEWRRHWPVAVGSIVGNGTGVALYTYVSSLFIPSLQQEFGWSRGDISSAAALGYFACLSAPLVGRAIDRFGVRPLGVACALLGALSYLGFAFLDGSLLMFTLFTFGLIAAAPGNSSPLFSKALSGWFFRSRGLALGLSACGVPLMAIVAPLLLQGVMAVYGWRAGFIALAVGVAFIGIPVLLATIREAPRNSTDGPAEHGSGHLSLGGAARTPAFWLMLAAIFLCTTPAQGFLSQLTPLLLDNGFTVAHAAAFLSVYSVSVVIGRLGTGLLLDRFPPYLVAFVVTLIPAGGLLLFIGTVQPDFIATGLAIAIIGIQNGGESDIIPYLIAREFGLRSYSTISGFAFIAMFAASAFGVFMLGKCYDMTGSYNLALAISILFFAAAATCFLAIGFAHRRRVAGRLQPV